MLIEEIIEKGSRLMGLPKNTIKCIIREDIEKGINGNKILEKFESMKLDSIFQRVNLAEKYNTFITECMEEYIEPIVDKMKLAGIPIIESTFESEEISDAFTRSSKCAKEKVLRYIQENDNFLRVRYVGKNITSKCSKIPHVPHYDINNKTFCCGVKGEIELLDYSIRIITILDTVKGNKAQKSAIRGAYKLQIIENDKEKII